MTRAENYYLLKIFIFLVVLAQLLECARFENQIQNAKV